jgi:hypothetical protein
MILAGVIPFVPAEGGPAEVVNGDERLLWRAEKEAISKIEAVLKDRRLQEQIRKDLGRYRYKFDPEIFKKEMLEIVHQAVNKAT